MKRKFLIIAMAAACMALAASCEKTEKPDNGENENQGGGNGGDDNTEIVEGISGAVSGVWSAGETIHVNGHINVPAGESLTIEEGVTVIFSSKGVGVNHVAIEFSVDGSLYCLGTEDAPVRLTVEESERTYDNTFAGLWGGIVAGAECPEMLIDHTIIEYTGGQVIEGSPAAENGYYTAGDDAYPQITTNNVDGNYVIINSVIRNGWSDGIYMMGGNAIIANNVFSANGYDGAEAVNVKSGCKVDVAGNIMYAPNTNGLKLSSSDQSEVRHQAQIQAYNNTIINSGWRRDGEKGGSVYVEENARVNVVNNLIVNCKFRAITPALDQLGLPDGGYDAEHSMIDYNFYASGNVESSKVWEGEYEDDGEMLEYSGVRFPWQGYVFGHEEYYTGVVDVNSIMADSEERGQELDPEFVNFNINADPAGYRYDESWDFHLTAGSPALEGAYSGSDVVPFYSVTGLTVNGKTYASPALGNYFGAYGMN